MSYNQKNKILDLLGYNYGITRDSLKIVQERIYVDNLEGDYVFWHVSDLHINYVEDESLIDFYGQKNRDWTPEKDGLNPLYALDFLIQEANKKNLDALILAGDLVDFCNQTSIDYVCDRLKDLKCEKIVALGNHEGSLGDPIITTRSFYPMYMELTSQKPDCRVVDYGHFMFATLDDSDLKIIPEQIEFLKSLKKYNKPVILVTHIPLITEGLEPSCMKIWGTTFMLGTFDDVDLTKEAVSIIKADDSPIIAVLAGHLHYENTSEFKKGQYQYCNAPLFTGFVREIIVTSKKD